VLRPFFLGAVVGLAFREWARRSTARRSVALWVLASLTLTALLAGAGYLVFIEVMMRAVFRAG
jgi:hypothetical protein